MSTVQTNPRPVIFVACLAILILGLNAFALESHTTRRFRDLAEIRSALAAYHRDHGAYPASTGATIGDGSNRPASRWLPDLAPEYIKSVPRDPRMLAQPNMQYLYLSDGKDYKLISHAPEDFGLASRLRPELIDPTRPTYAYGYWSEGASAW